MVDHSIQWTGVPQDRSLSLLGLDEFGDIATYDIQQEITLVADQRVDQFPPDPPVVTTEPVDFSIKAKMRTMYAIAASKNDLYHGWGDQSWEIETAGGGTVTLNQDTAGSDISVQFIGG